MSNDDDWGDGNWKDNNQIQCGTDQDRNSSGGWGDDGGQVEKKDQSCVQQKTDKEWDASSNEEEKQGGEGGWGAQDDVNDNELSNYEQFIPTQSTFVVPEEQGDNDKQDDVYSKNALKNIPQAYDRYKQLCTQVFSASQVRTEVIDLMPQLPPDDLLTMFDIVQVHFDKQSDEYQPHCYAEDFESAVISVYEARVGACPVKRQIKADRSVIHKEDDENNFDSYGRDADNQFNNNRKGGDNYTNYGQDRRGYGDNETRGSGDYRGYSGSKYDKGIQNDDWGSNQDRKWGGNQDYGQNQNTDGGKWHGGNNYGNDRYNSQGQQGRQNQDDYQSRQRNRGGNQYGREQGFGGPQWNSGSKWDSDADGNNRNSYKDGGYKGSYKYNNQGGQRQFENQQGRSFGDDNLPPPPGSRNPLSRDESGGWGTPSPDRQMQPPPGLDQSENDHRYNQSPGSYGDRNDTRHQSGQGGKQGNGGWGGRSDDFGNKQDYGGQGCRNDYGSSYNRNNEGFNQKFQQATNIRAPPSRPQRPAESSDEGSDFGGGFAGAF